MIKCCWSGYLWGSGSSCCTHVNIAFYTGLRWFVWFYPYYGFHPNTLSCDSTCLFGKFHHHVVTHVAAHAHCWMKCDGSSTYHGAPLVLPRAAPHRWAMETRNRGSGSPYCEVPFPSDNMILIFIPSVVWCSLAGNPAVTFFCEGLCLFV